MRRRFLNKNDQVVERGPSYLTIEALEDGLQAKLSINACEYRVDNGDWKTLSKETYTVAINKGQTLSFRGNLTPNSSNGIGTFSISKKCNLKGNCMSLLFGDNASNEYSLLNKSYAFYLLFEGVKTIINVSPTFLPATILGPYCYWSMFANCSNLVNSPDLSSLNLHSNCYRTMFKGCSSLTKLPKILPATTLTENCYQYMFQNCTSLTAITTELPAATLVKGCYSCMFNGCSNLTTPPNLSSVRTLAPECFYGMFAGATKLTEIPIDYLPFTKLEDSCYRALFKNCTNLTTPPHLPANVLKDKSYYEMFYGCSKLNYIKMLATDISASDCLYNWVYGVSSNGTFVKHPNMNSLPSGTNGIPSSWNVEDDFTPVECTSLTIAAEDVSGRDTTTIITYTAVVNGYDANNNPVTVTITGTVISEPFPQNTSETETIIRTISYTYMGVTATTTITQGVWINNYYTVNLNDNWRISNSISNPDSTTYDGVYESYSNYNINYGTAKCI